MRRMSPSLPVRPTAAAAIARFCGEIILPRTPPDELDAAIRVASRCALFAAVTCSAPNSELDDVSEPVTATPSQPRIGDSTANALPAPAIQLPSVAVWPLAFITNAMASTAITVMMAQRSCRRVAPYARTARAGLSFSTGIVTRPAISIRLPAAVNQLNLNTGSVDGLPAGVCRCMPGQLNDFVTLSRTCATGPS